MRIPLLTLTAVLSTAASLCAGPITVDGNWSDWGIDPNSGDWTASTGTRIFFENYTGTDGTGWVGPGWGGQYFDVEALYATRAGNDLCFAIITGFDPDGVVWGGDHYRAGDIFLDVGSGWKAGIDLSTRHLYRNATGSSPGFSSSLPFEITGGLDLGLTPLSLPTNGVETVYTNGSTSSTHYLFEGSVDLTRLGAENASLLGIHWTMSCGNDVGEGYLSAPPQVPEPATASLVLAGGAVAAWLKRRQRGDRR